jgi:hypothetical protein
LKSHVLLYSSSETWVLVSESFYLRA